MLGPVERDGDAERPDPGGEGVNRSDGPGQVVVGATPCPPCTPTTQGPKFITAPTILGRRAGRKECGALNWTRCATKGRKRPPPSSADSPPSTYGNHKTSTSASRLERNTHSSGGTSWCSATPIWPKMRKGGCRIGRVRTPNRLLMPVSPRRRVITTGSVVTRRQWVAIRASVAPRWETVLVLQPC